MKRTTVFVCLVPALFSSALADTVCCGRTGLQTGISFTALGFEEEKAAILSYAEDDDVQCPGTSTVRLNPYPFPARVKRLEGVADTLVFTGPYEQWVVELSADQSAIRTVRHRPGGPYRQPAEPAPWESVENCRLVQ